MKVLICDDEANAAEEILKSLDPKLEVTATTLSNSLLKEELGNFFDGIQDCLKPNTNCKEPPRRKFDDADLLFVDNNLAHLQITGTRLTAESIVGYIRAFTSVPYIVSLNKNPEVDFDLRHLVGDHSTRADLALNTEHLSNPSLWTGAPKDATDEFCPWYWPSLYNAPKRRAAQIEYLRKHIDEPVVGALHLTSFVGALLPHATGALSPETAVPNDSIKDAIPLDKLSFYDVFLARDRSLPAHDERATLVKAAKAGNAFVKELVARVVAAEIDYWFRREVVGPQEPLVDLPHLLLRFPFLLGDRAKDVDQWNAAIQIQEPPYGIDKQLYEKYIAPTAFPLDLWVPKPCFAWPQRKSNEELNDFFFSVKQVGWEDVVFCEDTSSFVKRLGNNGKQPLEFPAEFEGSWGRRHVAHLSNIRYAPRSRFAL